MKFGQQKFFIFVLLVMLPLLGVFSLLEYPYLSQSLLKFSLRFVNFRTGIPVSAASWDLHPTTFSASLSNVDFSTKGIYFRAEEIEIQLSPVDLIFGMAKFRSITTRNVSMKGKVPDKWFESDPNEPSPKLNELANLFSKNLQEINQKLANSKIGFTELAVERANFDFSNLKVKDLNLRVINQSRGQARVDVSLQSAMIPKKLAETPSLSVSLSLVREKTRFVFLIRSLVLGDETHSKESISISGRVPGQLSARLNLDLKFLNEQLSRGEWTKEFYQANLSGLAVGSFSFTFDDPKSWNASIEDLAISDLVYDIYKLKRLEFSGDYNSKKQIGLRKANFILPPALSDPRSWKQSLSLAAIKVKADGSVEGELRANELGLCSVMIATAVNECFASVQLNGPVSFVGTFDPLKLNIKTDWTLSAATVYSEPEVPGKKGQDPLVKTKAGKFVASMLISDKYMTVLDSSVTWGTSKLGMKGDIRYIPTKVELDIKSDRVELSDIIATFMDQPISGFASVKTQIVYDYSIPKRADRTKIFGSLEVDKFSYAKQLIGQLNAPILYEAANLNIGPASLASGGGTAILRGVLENRPQGKSRLEASATLRRYETSINSASGKNVVRGFYTGVVKIDGFLSEMNNQQGIRGRISGALDSAEVLGIGLSRVEGAISLKGSDLVLDELRGQKNKKTITASGLIAAAPGQSFVNFSAKDIDVVGLGWDPEIESLFSSGKVSITGKWSEKDGYRIDGDITGLADPTYSYGGGKFEAIGDDNSLRFGVDLKSGFALSANGTYRGDNLEFNNIEATLKNQGLFLGLSYLNHWKEKVDLQTTGALNLKYNGNSGTVVLEDLRLRKHNSTGQMGDVILVQGKHTLNWDKSAIRGDVFKSTGASALEFNPTRERLAISGKWSSELIDLFIPDFVRLRDGYADGVLSLGVPFNLNSLRGNFALNGVSMGVNGLGRYGQNTSGNLEIKDSRILFSKLRSNFGTGHVDLSGEYKIDTKNPGLYLNADLSNAEFVFADQVPAVTTGSVVLSGSSYPFDVRGRVAVTEGLYAAETSSSAGVAAAPVDPVLKFDIAIDLGSKFAVRNSLISTNATGTMRLIGTDVNPTFVGIVQLENGRVFARDNEFKIIRGVVDFPATSDNIFINVTATTDIKTSSQTYTITLNATGTTDEPNIEFQSNPPLSLPDIASLLAFGVTRSDESLDSSTSLADTARAEALQTIFGKTIGSSLRKRTGLDVRVSTRANLEQKQTIPKVTVVRKLSKKVTATFGRSLDFSRPENDVQIDYELLRNVNVSGVWENPNPKESSVGFDLRFKWDVK